MLTVSAPPVVLRTFSTHSSPGSTLSTIGSVLSRAGRVPAAPPALTAASAWTIDSAPVVRFITQPTAVVLMRISSNPAFGGKRYCQLRSRFEVAPAAIDSTTFHCGMLFPRESVNRRDELLFLRRR